MRIDIDTCEEILITITRNKTRSLLTAFGVFWGIFMLVALIGGGQGLEYMLKKNFEGFATNSGFLASQRTGEAYKGFRKGRWWNLESTDIERLRSQVKEVEVITPSVARWGSKAVYEDKKYDCSVKGLYPDYLLKNGLAVNPATPFETLLPFLGEIDLLLVMSVVPGFGGQSFMPSVLDKVVKAAEWRADHQASFLIQMDGGIGKNNADQCALAGADVLVAGSSTFKAADMAQAIAEMK